MSKMLGATYLLMALPVAVSAAGQEASPPQTTILNRASSTITGQPIAMPAPALEVVISRTEIPAGGALPMHRHPWPRYAIVESGRLRVRYEEAGLVREFGPGEAVIEAIGQWHEAQVVGAEPVRIIVIDHVPPGQTNLIRRPN
ncbi:cupin domain-containing protein [Sphingosinicella sp.]|uniref:cupin domain-containing protein n=1 Tax=Sphingosinicella sp. TaxID=1917971 RepID=UPI0040382841